MNGFHIIIGNYGKLMVDNLNTAWIDSFSGALHEGHGKASFYIEIFFFPSLSMSDFSLQTWV